MNEHEKIVFGDCFIVCCMIAVVFCAWSVFDFNQQNKKSDIAWISYNKTMNDLRTASEQSWQIYLANMRIQESLINAE